MAQAGLIPTKGVCICMRGTWVVLYRDDGDKVVAIMSDCLSTHGTSFLDVWGFHEVESHGNLLHFTKGRLFPFGWSRVEDGTSLFSPPYLRLLAFLHRLIHCVQSMYRPIIA